MKHLEKFQLFVWKRNVSKPNSFDFNVTLSLAGQRCNELPRCYDNAVLRAAPNELSDIAIYGASFLFEPLQNRNTVRIPGFPAKKLGSCPALLYAWHGIAWFAACREARTKDRVATMEESTSVYSNSNAAMGKWPGHSKLRAVSRSGHCPYEHSLACWDSRTAASNPCNCSFLPCTLLVSVLPSGAPWTWILLLTGPGASSPLAGAGTLLTESLI